MKKLPNNIILIEVSILYKEGALKKKSRLAVRIKNKFIQV